VSGAIYSLNLIATPPWIAQEFAGAQADSGAAGKRIAQRDDLAVSYGLGKPHSYRYADEHWRDNGPLPRSDENHSFNEMYGDALATDGATIVIGAPLDNDNGTYSGSAYVWERDAAGNWFEAAKLLASNGDSADNFGAAVAVNGDLVVVGAPADEPFANWSGSAYLFERVNGTWTETINLLASDGAPIDNYGHGVATNGEDVLIGSPRAARSDDPGAVYVYRRTGPGWTEVQLIQPDDGRDSDNFGAALAVDGNLMVVGAYQADTGGLISAGAAYVFWRDEAGEWRQAARLNAPDPGERDEFGRAVAIRGNRVIVGAWHDDDLGADSGSAYIFEVGPDRDGNGLLDLCECRADLNLDRQVTLSDLAIQLVNFGRGVHVGDEVRHEHGDLDLDIDIDVADLALMLAAFDTGCQ